MSINSCDTEQSGEKELRERLSKLTKLLHGQTRGEKEYSSAKERVERLESELKAKDEQIRLLRPAWKLDPRQI